MNSKKITYEEFQKVEIKIGKIISAEKIPEADRLLKLSVDFGDERRQIVAGIALYYPEPSVLVGTKRPFATNIAPRMIKGYESDGMILAASDEEGRFSLLSPDRDVPSGAKIR